MRRLWLTALMCFVLQSCSQDGRGGPLGLVLFDRDQHTSSAEPLFSRTEDNCASSPLFIMAATSPAGSKVTWVKKNRPDPCEALANNLRSFAPLTLGSNGDGPATLDQDKLQRNAMVDSMIAASNRKCGRYIDFLKAYDGNINITYGIASLVTAGASPLVAGEATAKTLAGISAMLNGSRQTFNEAHFANQTIQVLAAAIDKLRQQERISIAKYEQCPVSAYSTASGFADAMNYHTSCSVIYGLAETAKDVERANSPDIATMKQMMSDLVALRKSAAAFATEKGGATGAAGTAGGAAAGGAAPKVIGAVVAPQGAAASPAGSAGDDSDNFPSCPFSKVEAQSVAGIAKPVMAGPGAARAPAKKGHVVHHA